jgi:hypothetical protein
VIKYLSLEEEKAKKLKQMMSLFLIQVQNKNVVIWLLIIIICEETLAWSRPRITGGSKPQPRGYHSSTLISPKEILIFGGSREGRPFNDLFVFNTGNIIIFSFFKNVKIITNILPFLFLKASNGWEEKKQQGTIPPPLYAHSATLVGKNVYVFGGTDGTKYFNTVFVLDLGL